VASMHDEGVLLYRERNNTMQIKFQSVMNTLVYSPAQRITEGVRHYSSQLNRWVKNHTPSALLNTPNNRAIVQSNYSLSAGGFARLSEPTSRSRQIKDAFTKVSWHLHTDDNRTLEKTDFQRGIDLLCRPLLKMFIPASVSMAPFATLASKSDEVPACADDNEKMLDLLNMPAGGFVQAEHE